MNPAEWLVRTERRAPESPALLSGDRLVASYTEFRTHAAAIGSDLVTRGIGKGDRVAIFMTNRPEYLEAMYGIWFAGAAAVPINAKLHAKEAAWIIEDSGAKLVLSDDKLGPGPRDASAR